MTTRDCGHDGGDGVESIRPSIAFIQSLHVNRSIGHETLTGFPSSLRKPHCPAPIIYEDRKVVWEYRQLIRNLARETTPMVVVNSSRPVAARLMFSLGSLYHHLKRVGTMKTRLGVLFLALLGIASAFQARGTR